MDSRDPRLPPEVKDNDSKSLLIKQDNIFLTNTFFSIDYTPTFRGSINLDVEKYIQMREELAKLRGYVEGESKEGERIRTTLQAASSSPSTVSIDINNTNNVKASSNIDFAYQAISSDEMQESHTPEEIESYKKQLDELKKIIESDEKKSKKWKTAGSIVKWLAEQTVDVAKVFGPVILKELLGIGE